MLVLDIPIPNGGPFNICNQIKQVAVDELVAVT